MSIIRVIEAYKKTQQETVPEKKLRVCAYTRVSTELEEQESSFEAKQTYFRHLVLSNPAWELVDIYADQESGTSTQKRENFMRMIQDCRDGKIDLVLIKSISRFARNTLDSLKYIRELKALGIPIIFSKENINSMDGSGEVLVTILSAIAQQESASISQNCQLGVKYHYQEGKAYAGNHKLLGLDRTAEGSFTIVQDEAWIIRRIFREYLDGYSPSHIAERLKADGVDGTKTTRRGIEIERTWNCAGIKNILRNEKYCGDVLLQKYYTVDFLTKKVARNRGEKQQYYVENGHAPIVPKEIFNLTRAEMERRSKNGNEVHYLHNYALSRKVICGQCGGIYTRSVDKGYQYWRCQNRKRKINDCKGEMIKEDQLKDAVVEALNRLPEMEQELITIRARLRVSGIAIADEMLRKIDQQIEAGEDLTAKRTEIAAQKTLYEEQDLAVRNLLERITAMESQKKKKKDDVGACADPEEFYHLTGRVYEPGPVTEYNEDDVTRLVERIVIGEKIRIEFKAGVSVEV